MIPIVTPEEMREIDLAAPEPVDVLIARAGRAVANAAVEMLGGTYARVVTVIAGPGNNGADGRVAAAILARRGVVVRIVDAADCPTVLAPCDLVIDAAFGTGYRPNPGRGQWAAPSCGEALVLAVDIPSGLDALTGLSHGAVLTADRTVTFQALKPGLLVGRGPELGGRISVADVGLDVSGATAHLVERGDVEAWWPRRSRNAHKWSSAVRVVAGGPGMQGAGHLCSAAALRAGAGLVSLSSPGCLSHARDEVVQPPLDADGWDVGVLADLHRFASLAIGPGLGRREPTIDATRRVIADATVPVVIDGDALFAAAWSSDGPGELLRSRGLPTVITPHDGEFAVLTGAPPGADRVDAVRRVAHDFGVVVLLKGPTTVVADPTGAALLIDHGDDRLATAGSGDVLTGIVSALLACGLAALEAAAAGAWIHAEVARSTPRAGMLAGDLVEQLPPTLDALRAEEA